MCIVENKSFTLLQAFCAATGYFPRGIIDMLKTLQLSHQGKLHSGIGKESFIALDTVASKGYVCS